MTRAKVAKDNRKERARVRAKEKQDLKADATPVEVITMQRIAPRKVRGRQARRSA